MTFDLVPPRRAALLLLALCLALGAALASPAGAALPQGNLLRDGDAEATAGVSDDSSVACPIAYWSNCDTGATVVRYGAPGFPGVAESKRIGGGTNFFAGGPNNAGSNIYKGVGVGGAQPEVDSSAAVVTLGGCLGGFESQGDSAALFMRYFKEDMSFSDSAIAVTPNRGGQTKLLPAQVTEVLPQKTRSILAYISFDRAGAGTYNDGYADNVSLRLSAVGTVPPSPECTGPGGGGQGGNGNGSGGGGRGTVLLSKVGKSATLSHGRIVLRLRCLAHDGSCKGKLTLSVRRLPAAARAVTLGSARFSIKAGKTGKVKVRVRRRAGRRLRALGARRIRRVKVTVKALIGKTPSKFVLRLKR
jgi:hypothetical protein